MTNEAEKAREIVNQHLEYEDGLARGQIMMRVENAIAAVESALSLRGEVIEALTYYAEDVNAALDDDRDDEGYGRIARAAIRSLANQESGNG